MFKFLSPVSLLQKHVIVRFASSFSDTMNGLKLSDIISRLTSFAPPSLAGSWDNVGLLVEPSPPHIVSKVLLTNDLTECVLEEALKNQVNLILSYHPPVFAPLKRITQSSWKERIVAKCLENRIGIFSPHTTYDAISGGVNDWLLTPFSGKTEPLELAESCSRTKYKLEFCVDQSTSGAVSDQLSSIKDVHLIGKHSILSCGKELQRLTVTCGDKGLPQVSAYAWREEVSDFLLTSLAKVPIPDQGAGRLITLDKPTTLQEVVNKVKSHLQLTHVRLAVGKGASLEKAVKTIAVCAGSGSSVLKNVSADVYLTGEMSHHEILDAVHKKRSVILCDHSNTERGFLSQVLHHKLNELFENQVQIIVSETDADPLNIV